MKIIFMGTPDFAVPSLERLLQDGHEIVLVVTQEDKPQGRHRVLTPPPVKECALQHGIAVYQPKTLKSDEAFETLKAVDADLIAVVAYGKILPPRILEMTPYGAVNVHGSLLPKYRGSAPIQWAVLNGDTVSGVTTQQMNEGIDTGDILMMSERAVPADMTAGELFDALCGDGAVLLSDTIKGLLAGTLTPQKQNEAEASYVSMLDKTMCPLDFSKSAVQLHNQVRGLHPWPVATCLLGDTTLKIHKSRVGGKTDAAAGKVIALSPFTVACGDGTALEILELQAPGSKRMAATDFLRGHPIAEGTVLK